MQQSIARFDRVCQIIDKYDKNPNKLIPILQEVQAEYHYLPENILTFLSTALDVPTASVYGVATFYAHFTLSPKGKYIIKVCDGTACHVKKSADILRVLEEELGLNPQRKTSDDLLFTLETVACLGACGLAPVMVINDQVYGMVTPDKARTLIKQIQEEEAGYAR